MHNACVCVCAWCVCVYALRVCICTFGCATTIDKVMSETSTLCIMHAHVAYYIGVFVVVVLLGSLRAFGSSRFKQMALLWLYAIRHNGWRTNVCFDATLYTP